MGATIGQLVRLLGRASLMIFSQFQLRFRVEGPALAPGALTEAIGIQPTTTRLVGDPVGNGVTGRTHESATWQWWSSVSGRDIEPIVDEFLDSFQGRAAEDLRRVVDEGAQASLTVVGHVSGEIAVTVEAAERLGYEGHEEYLPMFVGDTPIGLSFRPALLALLGSISATLESYIDVDRYANGPFSSDHPIWKPMGWSELRTHPRPTPPRDGAK